MGKVEAILLVGGMGTRLRPLTVNTPKPMLPVAGVPFIAHQLAQARAAGVTHVVLATSYRAEVFEAWLGHGDRLGLEVDYVTEEEPLGTGGAIRNASSGLRADADEPVLIFNGDVLSGHDIGAQLRLHAEHGADVTLYLTEVADARAFGCVPLDDHGRVTAFLEKMPEPVTNRINAGCYVFRRSVIDRIPEGKVVSVERETFPGLLADGAPVMGYVDTAYWLDLGTPEAFVQGSRDLVTGALASPALPGPTGERLILDGASVHETARVFGGSAVGRDAMIEAGAVVDGSVIQDGVQIRDSARIVGSVVCAGAVIGPRTRLDGCVVGDGAQIGADVELAPGSRVWTNAVLADRAVRLTSDL
ncbi:MAG: NDP-sugar synthase [Candidatus Nanopelagicales bacterium]